MVISTSFEWPLAIELALVFVVLTYVRWRFLRSRLRRLPPRPRTPLDGE
ncbi:MAG TPA: hypothetical protein VF929_10365 [Gemmatimonadaceae bacterium]